jgi:hypothetical protein|tara:strand:+ start:584 stop:766 length:183 start_codon:yes stop_codon:yes gene_type:complete
MEDGPFKQYLEQDMEGVIRQELITYKIEDGVLKRQLVTRDFQESGDYHDSSFSLPLVTMH